MKKNTLLTLLSAVLLGITIFSCSKSKDVKPTPNPLAALVATWSVSVWGGVQNNPLTFSISSNATTAVITQVGSQPFNFAVGDQLYSSIAASGTNSWTCMGKYTYGVNNATVAQRPAVMSLQNGGTELEVDYPANNGFAALTYFYQKQ